jgi:AraC family transcriptional regulator of adaptative response / DNA-3-methyladenine glycosylase II
VLDFETCYRAMASRDPRFDGLFVVAVSSTGVYCRPVCPSRTPTRANTRFFRIPAAAEAAGYRACRRCRPDSAPESPEWNARGDLVARGLRMIAAGVVDEVGVSGLARLLVESQTLSLADVAFAAGYASVRQFNHGMRTAFGKAPRELRAAADGSCNSGPLVLRLRYRPPLPVDPLLGWFGLRALPGVETVSAAVDAAVDGVEYRRTVRLPHAGGRIALRVEADHVAVQLRLGDLRDVTAAVRRCRELLDLAAADHRHRLASSHVPMISMPDESPISSPGFGEAYPHSNRGSCCARRCGTRS